MPMCQPASFRDQTDQAAAADVLVGADDWQPAEDAPQPAADELYSVGHDAGPAGDDLQPADDGTMWWNPHFRERLRRAGLESFEQVMSCSRGRCIRRLKRRENWYLPCDETEAGEPGFYLKKHRVRSWLSRLRAWLRLGPGETPARREVRYVRLLASDGIEVMSVVAYGEQLQPDGRLEAFLLTEELRGYEDLARFLRRRFPPRPAHITRGRDQHLLRLIERIAEVARRLHQAGYNHRDFYCCHFFVREPSPGEFHVRLIDLQRVQRHRWRRRRWLIKDLAQLAWSAPRERIGLTHRLAFLRHYLGRARLSRADKRLLRAVFARQQVMERRLGTEP